MFPKSVSHVPVHKKSPEKLDNSHEDSFLQSEPAIKHDSSDAKQRKASNSIFNCHLEKAPADQTGRDFFSKNLHTILNQREILSSCPFFQLPITLNDGTKINHIKTCVCSDIPTIERELRLLKPDEAIFVVFSEVLDSKHDITTALFSKKATSAMIKDMVDGFLGSGLEFFGIAFYLNFNKETITMGVGVHQDFQRQGICTSVSLKILEKIYKHLGGLHFQQIRSSSATHLAFVKFFYPP